MTAHSGNSQVSAPGPSRARRMLAAGESLFVGLLALFASIAVINGRPNDGVASILAVSAQLGAVVIAGWVAIRLLRVATALLALLAGQLEATTQLVATA